MGQQRALVIGVSNYPPPIPSLPGVANDAKAMADLLGSPQGQFRGGDVTVLTDAQATGAAIHERLDDALGKAGWDDTVFVYMAGHGKVHNGAYYFAAHDTDRGRLAETGVQLANLRTLFDDSQSRRVFVWLDFCHSGGVIERDLTGGDADAQGRRARQKQRHGLQRLHNASLPSSVASSFSGSTGFTRWLSKPEKRASSTRASRSQPVTATSYTPSVSGWARSWRATVKPSHPRKPMLQTTESAWQAAASRTPPVPV